MRVLFVLIFLISLSFAYITEVRTCENTTATIGDCNATQTLGGANWTCVEQVGGNFSCTVITNNSLMTQPNLINIETYAGYFFGGGSHFVEVQVWNSTDWVAFGNLTKDAYGWINMSGLESSLYAQDGVVQVKFDHSDSTAANHYIEIDYVAISFIETNITYPTGYSQTGIPYLVSGIGGNCTVALTVESVSSATEFDDKNLTCNMYYLANSTLISSQSATCCNQTFYWTINQTADYLFNCSAMADELMAYSKNEAISFIGAEFCAEQNVEGPQNSEYVFVSLIIWALGFIYIGGRVLQ